MTPDLEALARRAVACPRWRWMAGMRVIQPSGGFPLRIDSVEPYSATHEGDHDAGPCIGVHGRDIPDLSDPATLGCLEHLVTEAHGGAVVLTRGNGWFSVETEVGYWDDDSVQPYQRALVLALEAAP